jgi:copper chaperone NosL
MKVKTDDDWTAEIYYKDQTKLMFESPGDMLVFYTSPSRFDMDWAHKDLANIQRIVVKDYQSKHPIDGAQAKYVYESKVEGPMGPDFLPFGTREDAEAFAAANGGTVLSIKEVTGEMARGLRK